MPEGCGMQTLAASRWGPVTVALMLSLAGCLQTPDLTQSAKYRCETTAECLYGYVCVQVDRDRKRCVLQSEADAYADTKQDTAAPDVRDAGADTVTGHPNGAECDQGTDCQSGNCRLGPDGTGHCVPQGAACSDGQSGGSTSAPAISSRATWSPPTRATMTYVFVGRGMPVPAHSSVSTRGAATPATAAAHRPRAARPRATTATVTPAPVARMSAGAP